jgi:hypothetical protein
MDKKSMDDLLSTLSFIAMYKSWLPLNLRGWVNILGLHVQERKSGVPGSYRWTRLQAGGSLRSYLDVWREGDGDWQVKKFDAETWECRFAHLVEPTYEIAEFLSQRVRWFGDLDVEGAAVLNQALQRYRDTGIWLGLPKVPEDVIDKRLEEDASAEAKEEQKRRVRLISNLEKKVRKDSLDRSAWSSLSELYLKEGRNKDAENATKTLLELDVQKLGKANPFTYRQLAEIYLDALSVSVRGKGIRILGYILSHVTAEALGYSIEELSELAKENLIKADWAYTKEGRDLALRAVSTLAVEAFEEFDKYKE